MFQQFFSICTAFVHFSEQEKRIIENHFTIRHVPKGFTLIKENSIARELYFINKGLLRLFYTKDGEDITAFIFKENLFTSSYESFLKQSPGIQTLETLENSELLVISYTDLNKLYELVPAMNILARKIAEQRFINAQMILSSYILDSPEERYKKFEAAHGDLLLRVPHYMIASFLGITPVSLSRIRRRLAHH